MTTLTDCVIARWTLLVAAPIDRHGVGERLGAAYENQMVKARGATTMWEWWEGIDADGKPHESLNHYSKGAVIGFLRRYTAGIRLGDEPAYRTFTIADAWWWPDFGVGRARVAVRKDRILLDPRGEHAARRRARAAGNDG